MCDRPPVWKRTLAAKIARLIETPAVLARFQEMVIAWCRHRHDSQPVSEPDSTTLESDGGADLTPLPDRRLTTEESYVVLAGLHDSVRDDHHVNPWRAVWDELERECDQAKSVEDGEVGMRLLESEEFAEINFAIPYAVLLDGQKLATEDDLPAYERILSQVEKGLGVGEEDGSHGAGEHVDSPPINHAVLLDGQKPATEDDLPAYEQILTQVEGECILGGADEAVGDGSLTRKGDEPEDCWPYWWAKGPPANGSEFKFGLMLGSERASLTLTEIAESVNLTYKTLRKHCKKQRYYVCLAPGEARRFQLWLRFEDQWRDACARLEANRKS